VIPKRFTTSRTSPRMSLRWTYRDAVDESLEEGRDIHPAIEQVPGVRQRDTVSGGVSSQRPGRLLRRLYNRAGMAW